MKRLLQIETSLTGAGLQVLRYCLRKGYHTTLLTSNLTKYNELCDKLTSEFKNVVSSLLEIEKVNTSDYELLYSKVKMLSSKNPMDGIFTTSDVHVPKAAFLTHHFKKPGLSLDGALSARDKFCMRQALEIKAPFLNPKFAIAKNFLEAMEKIAELGGYPLIAKPRNSNDSIGVVRIADQHCLERYFHEYNASMYDLAGVSYPEEILLESFIDGEEYSIETLHLDNQEPVVLGISKKRDFGGMIHEVNQDNVEPGNYTELSITFPDRDSNIGKMAAQIAHALPQVGINYGIIHTEFKITTSNEIKILEVNPRLAGDMLGSHCIPYATGINTAQAIVELALGNSDAVPTLFTKQHGSSIVGIFSRSSGEFDGFENLQEIESFLVEHSLAHEIILWKTRGEKIRPAQSNADLLGRIAVEAKTLEEALALCRYAAKELKICYKHLVEPNHD